MPTHIALPSIIAAMSLGQTLLCLTLLAARGRRRPTDLPLMATLGSTAFISMASVSGNLFAMPPHLAFALALPAWLTLVPALYLYVEALTSETPWHPARRHLWHAAPAAIGLVTAGLISALDSGAGLSMFGYGRAVAGPYPTFVALDVFTTILVGAGLSGLYGSWIVTRLAAYRRRIMDLFANNDRRELAWVGALVAGIAAACCLAVASLLANTIFNVPLLPAAVVQAVGLALVWSLALFGTQQTPGFEGRYQDEALVEADPAPKYAKSPMADGQIERIAARIEAAMRDDRLYLDPDLSLSKLASHIKTPPNLISQTLSVELKSSFFAYVNGWRVEAAKPLLRGTADNVLDITLQVGFNSRSAFYKAFRAVTGETPRAYRDRAEETGEDPIQ